MSSGTEESTSKGSYYRLMLYAGLIGGLVSLVTTGYITLLGSIAYIYLTLTFGRLFCWIPTAIEITAVRNTATAEIAKAS